jgi:hypothetical protein
MRYLAHISALVILLVIGTYFTSTSVFSSGDATFSGIVTAENGFRFPDGSIQQSAAPPGPLRFVGISEAVEPNLGLRTIDEQCQTNFGPNTRMCFAHEVHQTIEWPSVHFNSQGRMRANDPFDFDNNCSGWRDNTSGTSLSVSSNGEFIPWVCSSTPIGAACCVDGELLPPPT